MILYDLIYVLSIVRAYASKIVDLNASRANLKTYRKSLSKIIAKASHV